jgi:outer membrane lipoprotein SlyB
MMIRSIGAAALLAFVSLVPTQQAAAQNALGGAIVGGAMGGIIGGAATGRAEGAAVGAVIGATTGALIGAEADRRNGYYYWRNGCYRSDAAGNYYRVNRRYC